MRALRRPEAPVPCLKPQDYAMSKLLLALCVLFGTQAATAATPRAPRTAPAAAGAGWAAQGCGREPAVPAVEGGSVERYNASVDRVTEYDKAARAYNACVAKEATAEETAASEEARRRIAVVHAGSSAVRERIAANFTALSVQLKQAGSKLPGGKDAAR
jgi:hypothetical protein